MQEMVQALTIATFTFGLSIFYFLSRIEHPAFKLVNKRAEEVKKEDVSFVYQVIKKLIPTLPSSFGLVILVGSILLVVQGFIRSWDLTSIFIILYFWLILLYLVLIRKNPLTVKKIRKSSPHEKLEVKKENLKNLIIDHNLGLIANLGVLIIELVIVIMK